MRIHGIIFSITLTLAGCSRPQEQNEIETQDTTQLNREEVQSTEPSKSIESDTIDTEDTEAFSGITNNFPNFTIELYTNDSLEAEITDRMSELLLTYDTIQYKRIVSTYWWERSYYSQAQEGEGTRSIESKAETKTWLFDKDYQLRGFSMELRQEGNGTYTKSIIYLFSNDILIAVSEQTIDDSEVEVIGQERMLTSLCPQCGTSTTSGAGPEGTVSYLSEKDLTSREYNANESLTELISLLKDGNIKKKLVDLDYTFSIDQTEEENTDQESEDITYPVRFSIDKGLFTHIILAE